MNFVRRIVSAGPAKLQPASHAASPIVFVPTSSPASLPCGTAAANSAAVLVISAAKPRSSAPHRAGWRPRTERSRRRDNCCRAGRTVRAPGCRRRAAEAVIAVRADFARLERRLGQVRRRNERARIGLRRRRAVLRAGQRVHAKHVLSLALDSGRALRSVPGVHDQVGVGGLPEALPGQHAAASGPERSRRQGPLLASRRSCSAATDDICRDQPALQLRASLAKQPRKVQERPGCGPARMIGPSGLRFRNSSNAAATSE